MSADGPDLLAALDGAIRSARAARAQRTPEHAAGLRRVRERLARPHRLTEYGTTDCPVQQVRAEADGGTCSACGAPVQP